MFTLKRELELFLFILFTGAISIMLLAHKNSASALHFVSPKLPIFLTAPVPPVVSPTPSLQIISVDSPDSSKSLILKKQAISQKTTRYSFSILTKSTNSDQFLFMRDVVPGQSYVLPANAWSPDNSYVFIKETTPHITNYYVLSVNDNSLAMGENKVNIQELFIQKYPNYIITDVTGWAAPNLIIVNTTTNTGAFLSFWFDIPSKSFIPLATQFH